MLNFRGARQIFKYQKDLKEHEKCIYMVWPWKVPKWPWFWAEVAVKAWRDLATLVATLGQSNLAFFAGGKAFSTAAAQTLTSL
jgi:hypothetical protein